MEFGAVYEHSPWVANEVFDEAMEDCLDMTTLDAETLADRFQSIFMKTPADRQLERRLSRGGGTGLRLLFGGHLHRLFCVCIQCLQKRLAIWV